MSLFTKLFGGDKEAEKAAKDLLEGLFGNQSKPAAQPSEPKPQQNAAPSRDPEPAAEPTGPSGFSWGEVMPNEPNQYNYGGAFWQYFEEIFREDFPAYRINKQVPQELKRFVYTFYDGGRK
ncbi:MAG: hypothetical protein ILO68_03690, partial [Clostridia bacterium]|nr:hypothetical protein [Clostridia bacterium]